MKTKYKYIHFEDEGSLWYCYNTKHKHAVGAVEWYQRWRKWVFSSYSEKIVLSSECLDDISSFMKQLPAKP